MPHARKPAYVRDIEQAIDDIGKRVRRYKYGLVYEEETRKRLIDPMLKALDWDLSDPLQVKIEYRTPAGKYADYALFRPGMEKPLMVLEAKAITEEDINYSLEKRADPPLVEDLVDFSNRDIVQLRGYVNSLQLTKGYGVLTNGDYWAIYNLGKGGRFNKKREHYFTVLNSPRKDSIENLKKLHRRNVLRLHRPASARNTDRAIPTKPGTTLTHSRNAAVFGQHPAAGQPRRPDPCQRIAA